jgi:hypothetical protein
MPRKKELRKPAKIKTIKRIKKPTKDDIPLYHKLEIGAGYNIRTKEHTTMNLYISDEMLKASERDRLRRLSEAEKIKEPVITIKPPETKNK